MIEKISVGLIMLFMCFKAVGADFSDTEFRTLLAKATSVVKSDLIQIQALCNSEGKCDEVRGTEIGKKLNWHVDGFNYRVSARKYTELAKVLESIPPQLDVLDKKVKAGKIKTYADSDFDMYKYWQNHHLLDPDWNLLSESVRSYYSVPTINALRDLNDYAMRMKAYDPRFKESIKYWKFTNENSEN